MNTNVEETCLQIAKLLSNHGHAMWSKKFRELAASFKQSPLAAKNAIRSLYGGMGSFNDVVLFDKSGQTLPAENSELDHLRAMLYKACQTSSDESPDFSHG